MTSRFHYIILIFMGRKRDPHVIFAIAIAYLFFIGILAIISFKSYAQTDRLLPWYEYAALIGIAVLAIPCLRLPQSSKWRMAARVSFFGLSILCVLIVVGRSLTHPF